MLKSFPAATWIVVPLLLAAKSLNLGVDDIVVKLCESVSLGRLKVATDSRKEFTYSGLLYKMKHIIHG